MNPINTKWSRGLPEGHQKTRTERLVKVGRRNALVQDLDCVNPEERSCRSGKRSKTELEMRRMVLRDQSWTELEGGDPKIIGHGDADDSGVCVGLRAGRERGRGGREPELELEARRGMVLAGVDGVADERGAVLVGLVDEGVDGACWSPSTATSV